LQPKVGDPKEVLVANGPFGSWRPLFLLSGVLILVGGMNHPRGRNVEMLAHPDWVWSHSLMLLGFLALVAGLVLFRRAASPLPERTSRWLRLALYGTVLQAIEMAFHTVSVVDGEHLAAGHSTPVLTTHMVLAVILYPVFAATIIGFIVATVRDRTLASPWIAWIGILGAAAHGLSAPLVVGLRIGQAGILFPMLMLLAIWLALAAVWPRRSPAPPALEPLPADE
jgi:hypothetical protein